MAPYSICCGLVVLTLVVLATWLAVESVPSFSKEIAWDRSNPTFYLQLEGLRGVLAVQVLLHHTVIHFFILPKAIPWQMPPSTFYSQLADAPVLMFFFLTGFLFWSKLLRKPKLDLLSYFSARSRRLIPTYILAMLWLFLLVAINTNFTLQTSVKQLLYTCARWLSFTLLGQPDINGLKNTWYLIAGTPWTLAFEWVFYLLLPFVTWFARKTYRCIYLLAASGTLFALTDAYGPSHFDGGHLTTLRLVSFVHRVSGHFVFSFGVGILVAAIRFRWPANPHLAKSSIASLVALLSIVVVMLFIPAEFFRPTSSLLLGLAFLCFVYGNDLWGLLTSSPVLMLGKCSYSLYLCHGLTLTIITSLLGFGLRTSLAALSTFTSWLLIAISSLIVLGVSLLLYVAVELPFISTKRNVERGRVPQRLRIRAVAGAEQP